MKFLSNILFSNKQSLLLIACLLLTACEQIQTVNFLPFFTEIFEDESEAETKESTSSNIYENSNKQTDLIEVVQDSLSENILPEAQKIIEWVSENQQSIGNIKGTSFTQIVNQAEIGDGNDWSENAIATSPVVVGNIIVAMDGAGHISAHNLGDLETIWQSGLLSDEATITSGGLAINQGIIFAVTSNGKMAAFNLQNGKKIWKVDLREAVRSALKVHDGKLYLVTSDNQLLAFNSATGEALWQYRAVSSGEGVFSTSTPAISEDGLIAVSFPSGDIAVLEADSGEQIWTDSLTSDNINTESNFYGVEASPIINDGMLIVGGISDKIIAYDMRAGIKLWEIKTGMVQTPWLAGDGLYFINARTQLIAANKMNGLVAWKKKLKLPDDEADNQPRYHGVFVANNQLITLREDGIVMAFSPVNGKKLMIKDLGEDIASTPAFIDNYGIIQTYDAELLLIK
jgi:outer membrane protein assembly factor BamB